MATSLVFLDEKYGKFEPKKHYLSGDEKSNLTTLFGITFLILGIISFGIYDYVVPKE